MGAAVRLTADDGHVLNAYRAAPEGEPRAGLVLVQEIFGVNDHIRGVCEDFAAQGYLVLAPALFDRKGPGIELGYSAETVDEGRALKGDLGWDGPMLDIRAGVDALEGAPKVGVVGYCWGGSLAWLAACRLSLDAAVGYYGGQIIEFVGETPDCPTMLHFGTEGRGHPHGRCRRDQDDPPRRHGPRLSGRRPRLQLRPARRLPRGRRGAGARPLPRPPRTASRLAPGWRTPRGRPNHPGPPRRHRRQRPL